MTTRILRLPEVLKLTGIPKSSLYKAMKDGAFPKSFKLGVRSCGWLEADVLDWVNSKAMGVENECK